MTQLQLLMCETDPAVESRQVVLPFTPVSKNVWDYWQPMWKSGYRSKWMKHLLRQFDQQQFPLGVRQAVCHATLWFGTQRRRDWQNYVHPLWNFVADALVEFGVIEDDTPDMFGVGQNGGITFCVDRRRGVAANQKRRTVIGFAFEL